MESKNLSTYLKNCPIEDGIYNELYLLQNNSFARILVFSALLKILSSQ